MTPKQRAVCEMYKLMRSLEQKDREAAFEVRLAIASMDAKNGWDMADVALAVAFGVWRWQEESQ